jgi:hypothetical protein
MQRTLDLGGGKREAPRAFPKIPFKSDVPPRDRSRLRRDPVLGPKVAFICGLFDGKVVGIEGEGFESINPGDKE